MTKCLILNAKGTLVAFIIIDILNVLNSNYFSGSPITVSCAYSGRVAVAYKKSDDNPNDKFVNLCVSIFECESTGWLALNGGVYIYKVNYVLIVFKSIV